MRGTSAKWKRCAPALTAVIFILSLFSVATRAQTPPNCPNGLDLKISAPQTSQGTLLRVELRSGVPLSDVKGTWAGHEVSFWQEGEDANIHRAYLGIDLEQAVGAATFTLTAKLQSGESVSCGASVKVRAGNFVIEKLTVDQKFVEPNPEDAARAEKEGERLHAIYATRTAEKLWDGNFRFPLAGPRRGSNFGSRRVLNGEARSPHTGLDIHAATGTPVHASQRGRVMLADELYYAGNTVVLDHGMGIYTFYCHLSKINVKEGDLVDAGTVIGLVGATGRVTGPHLHWGLEVNEARVNPLQILPTMPPPKKKPAVP